MLGAQPGQGPPAAFDQLGIPVGDAVRDPAHGIERCVDDEAGLLGVGQGAAVPGQKRLEQVDAAGPGIGQADQIPYGRSRLTPLCFRRNRVPRRSCCITSRKAARVVSRCSSRIVMLSPSGHVRKRTLAALVLVGLGFVASGSSASVCCPGAGATPGDAAFHCGSHKCDVAAAGFGRPQGMQPRVSPSRRLASWPPTPAPTHPESPRTRERAQARCPVRQQQGRAPFGGYLGTRRGRHSRTHRLCFTATCRLVSFVSGAPRSRGLRTGQTPHVV